MKHATRSAVLAASRHPQATEAFKEGLQSVFRQWTALELAIHHEWGGRNSSEKADSLVEDILQQFLGPEKIYKDDIALILEDYMDVNFSTVCEDNSPEELGELLVTMWRQCCAGEFGLVHNALAREFVRHEVLSQSQGLDETGDTMDSDGEEEEGGEEAKEEAEILTAAALGGGAPLGTVVEEEGKEEEAPSVPVVDPDGWQPVLRRSQRKKK